MESSLTIAQDPGPQDDDQAIVLDILGGNVDAFELLLDRYQDLVARIARKHVPREHVQEVAHEIFIRTYQSLGNYKGNRPFKHWLSKIAVRGCYDFWRDYYKRQETPVGSIDDEYWCRAGHIWSSLSQENGKELLEVRDLLHWALGHLSPASRTVLTLTYLEGYSTTEAAGLLGWSVPRVKIQSYRARRKLRKVLAKTLA
jgi:RNA polymerase sigma-70 factor (ECF subfamily)